MPRRTWTNDDGNTRAGRSGVQLASACGFAACQRRGRVGRSDPLATAREALDRHDWHAAYDAAKANGEAGEPEEEAARLVVLADASWWLGRLDDCIDARERAYAIYDELHDR